MNLIVRSILAFSFSILIITPAFAQNNLFINVDESTQARAEAMNDEFLVKKLYFTKQHQFVLLNPEVLEKDEISFTFFEDNTYQFKEKKRSLNRRGRYIWVGQDNKRRNTLLQIFGINDENDIPNDKRTYYSVAKISTSLNIAVGKVESFIDADGNTIHRRNGNTRGVDMSIAANANPIITTVVSFELHDVAAGVKYRVEPLPNTPEVHLLTIVDDSKSFAGLDGELSEKQKQKKKDYENYIKDKGYSHLVKKQTNKENGEFKKNVFRNQFYALEDKAKRKMMYEGLLPRVEYIENFSQKDLKKIYDEVEKHYKDKEGKENKKDK